MSSVVNNIPSLTAQRILMNHQKTMGVSLERLGTGLRINRGQDDPAGLVASEFLRAEKSAIDAAIGNAERANQVLNVAEGALGEVSDMLQQLEGLVDANANDAGITTSEKEANQLQIDAILQSIDRIANSTSFLGSKLFNGTFDYIVNSASTNLTRVQVNAAKVGPTSGTDDMEVLVEVTAQASAARVELQASATIATSGLTVEIAGNQGIQQFTFISGTAIADVAAAINTLSDSTGVSATVSGAFVTLDSTAVGSAQFVSATFISGNSAYNSSIDGESSSKDTGADAVATINGRTAQAVGRDLHVSSLALDVDVTINASASGTNGFLIKGGGGAVFNINPDINLGAKAEIGLPTLTTSRIGGGTGVLSTLASGGTNNALSSNLDDAQSVVRESINFVSKLRGRIGSFMSNQIDTTVRRLGVTLESVTAAESQIRDTDFAQATSDLTRSQILTQAATNALAIANTLPNNALQLLG